MVSLHSLGTAWTVWNVARTRIGPVGALIVTVAVLAGLRYLKPLAAETVSALAADGAGRDNEERTAFD